MNLFTSLRQLSQRLIQTSGIALPTAALLAFAPSLASTGNAVAQEAEVKISQPQNAAAPATETSANSAEALDTTEGKVVQIFDGKSFSGWNGDLKWFRIEEGTIIAGSKTERIPHNQFLCTDRSFRDFELTVEAKLVGQGNNAGVQFRTRRIPNDTEVMGFQADIGFVKDGTCWGALYDESRRRKFLAQSPDVALKAVKRGEWNQLRVIAKGDRIQIFLNGVQTVDYAETDPKIEKDGVIALQVHSGPPLEVYYRNIKLKEF